MSLITRWTIAAASIAITSLAPAQGAAPPRAVLVTGATSGIGRAITERLAANGFFVYAGARGAAEIADLSKIPNVQAVQLDVTSPAEIAAAVETVTRAGRGLYGIVNNAGVAIVAPLIEAEERDMQFIWNVNLYGPWRITKAFAPLVLAAKGRVVNISSLNGFVASPMIGAYSMSKHAIEAFGDGLEAELAPFGVKVSNIEPGNYGTQIGTNLLARMDTSVLKGSRFEAPWRATLAGMSRFNQNPPPDAVADAVLAAFSSATPKHRYLVVPVANQGEIVIRKLMQEVAQLNQDHAFSLDRDALVKMLDEALARTAPRK